MALIVMNAVVDENTVKNSLSGVGIHLVSVGQAHQRHAKIANANISRALGAILQIDVHHISILVEYGRDQLVMPRAALVEIKARRYRAAQ